jgi:hypothetical protein
MGSFNVNPTTILSKIHVRTPAQAESLSSRYVFLNLNNAEPNLGKPPGIFGGTYYSTLTSDEYLGIRYALLSNNHSGSAWRVWAYDNPRIAAYSKEGSLGIGDNAYPLNIKSFVYSNYAFDNQNNRYNSQSFSNKTFNVFALSGIYLFDSTTIGDPASAVAFIVTDEGNVGIGVEDPAERLTVNGNISSNGNFIQGSGSRVLGKNSHAEGLSIVMGDQSHAEGFYSGVVGSFGGSHHAEGTASFVGLRCNFLTYIASTRTLTFSPAVSSRIDDYSSVAAGVSAILYITSPTRFEPVVIESRDPSTGSIVLTKDVVGSNVAASIRFLVLPGNNSLYAHAEGYYAEATGYASHAEGENCWADGYASHAEGSNTNALNDSSHAEGAGTTSSGVGSHSEGQGTKASGYASHAEGSSTEATGGYSHAAGVYSNASHARSWIWHGSSITQLVSTTRTDQFMVSAAGGIYLANQVGIGTDSIDNALTVNGTISSNRPITVLGGDSNQWNSGYTTLNSISSIIPDPATTISAQIGVGTTALNSIDFLNTSSAQLLYTVPAGKVFLASDFSIIIDTVAGGNVSDVSLPAFRLYRSDTLTNAANQVTNQLSLTTPGTLITTNRYYRIGGSVTASNGKALVSGNDASPQNRIWFRVDSAGTNTYTGLSGRVLVTGNLI